MKQKLHGFGTTCELINDDALHNKADSLVKWESNTPILKKGYNSAMVAALYLDMLRHVKNGEWNLAANNAERLFDFVTGDNNVLSQIVACLLKAGRKHVFMNCFCKQCHEEKAENKCILYQIYPSSSHFRRNKDELKEKADNHKYLISANSIGKNIENRRIEEEADFFLDKDAIRLAAERRNAIKNSASKNYLKISICVDCQKLNKNCPYPETTRGSYERRGYYCPYFQGRVKRIDY